MCSIGLAGGCRAVHTSRRLELWAVNMSFYCGRLRKQKQGDLLLQLVSSDYELLAQCEFPVIMLVYVRGAFASVEGYCSVGSTVLYSTVLFRRQDRSHRGGAV